MTSNEELPLSKQKIRCPEEDCDVSAVPSNLRQHLTKKHNYSKDQMTVFNESLKMKKSMKNGTVMSRCGICNHACGSRSGVREHMRTVHKEVTEDDPGEDEPASKKILLDTTTRDNLEQVTDFMKEETAKLTNDAGKLLCPDKFCELKFVDRERLCEHFNDVHEECEIERVEFGTKVEYEEWRNQRLIETTTTFKRNLTKDIGADNFYVYEICQHEGEYESHGTKRRGHATKKKTGKKACLAFLKAKFRSDGSIDVVASFVHAIHDVVVVDMKLTSEQKNEVIDLMRDEWNNRQIQRKMEKKYDCENRLYWMSMDEIRQIRKSANLIEGRLHDDDLTSLELRINQNNPEDGFRLYEPPINSSGEGFTLVMILPGQLEILKKYSHRGISIDDTHHTTRYNLKLTTIICLNGSDRGYPCAFMLSTSVTENEVAKLFQCIKDSYPQFDPRYFISDDAPAFWNGFTRVYPDARAEKILCHWHVFENWKNYAKECFKTKPEEKEIVLNELHLCLKSQSYEDVNNGMLRILHYLKDLNTTLSKKMAEYLRVHYFGRVNEWANCFRVNAIFNTTMVSESWHAYYKVHILNGATNNRLDSSVCNLINGYESVVVKNMKQFVRGLSTACPRQAANFANCRKAMELIGLYCMRQISATIYEVWKKSNTEMVYRIVGTLVCPCLEEENTHCDCGACGYQFRCDCNYVKRGVACKHIHMIKKFGSDLVPEDDVEFEMADINVGANEIIEVEASSLQLPSAIPTSIPSSIPTSSAPQSIQESISQDHHVDPIDADEEEIENLPSTSTQQSVNVKYDKIKGLWNLLDAKMRKKMKVGDNPHAMLDEMETLLTTMVEKFIPNASAQLPPRNIADGPKTAREAMHRTPMQTRTNLKPARQHVVVPLLSQLIDPMDVAICSLCQLEDPVLPPGTHPEELESRVTSWKRCPKCKTPAHEVCAHRLCKPCQIKFQNSLV